MAVRTRAERGSARGAPRPPELPDWQGPQFKAIDTSVSTLLSQTGKAVGGMFCAFLVARLVATHLFGMGNHYLVLQALLFAFCGAISISLTSAVPIRKAITAQRAAIAAHEDYLREEAARFAFTASLQDALEMARDESDGLIVVQRALAEVTDESSELLLADSSRSHLRQAVVNAPNGIAPGCDVESPWSCPAVRRAQTLVFTSSETLDACPKLRDREIGACAAACVPVTVLGAPMGVIHMVAPVDEPPDEQVLGALESVARQSGSRLGVLRAMASSQLQAATDPLTGLLNRRSLEDEIRRLREEHTPYALAIADLDHFKTLNDTYGHETGDRALRLFARVLRAGVRERDIVCRYGGEEFVLVFPHCTAAEAAPIVERIRSGLLSALEHAAVPAFTSSFGFADDATGEEFDAVFRNADGALMQAKATGRDRIEFAVIGPHDFAPRH
jgi:diguanylate cyclase (GGDEF)-like protein